MVARDRRNQLVHLLDTARQRGMLGRGPVEAHLNHAESLAAAIGSDFEGRFLDLGSGAGVPGLILLDTWPAARGVLLDGRRSRCTILEVAVSEIEGGATAAGG